MDKNAYLIIGAGEVGPAIAGRLVFGHSDTDCVGIVDQDWRRISRVIDTLRTRRDCHLSLRKFPSISGKTLNITAASDAEIVSVFSTYNCVISAIPARFSPRLARLAAKASVHFCELGGVTSATKEIRNDKELASQAVANGVSIIHDCGFAPGLSGQMAQVLVRRADIVPRSVIVYVGGLPRHPTKESFYWQRTFSGVGMAELLAPTKNLSDGRWESMSCEDGESTLTFPTLAKFETEFGAAVKSRVTAGAGAMPEIMQKLGVLDCWEETIRWNWDAFLAFIRDIPLEERASAIEKELPHTDDAHPDIAFMRVVADSKRQRTHYELCTHYDTRLGMSAMAKVTGYAAADTARLAALGRTPAGVMAPEELNWQTNAELIDDLAVPLGITLRG